MIIALLLAAGVCSAKPPKAKDDAVPPDLPETRAVIDRLQAASHEIAHDLEALWRDLFPEDPVEAWSARANAPECGDPDSLILTPANAAGSQTYDPRPVLAWTVEGGAPGDGRLESTAKKEVALEGIEAGDAAWRARPVADLEPGTWRLRLAGGRACATFTVAVSPPPPSQCPSDGWTERERRLCLLLELAVEGRDWELAAAVEGLDPQSEEVRLADRVRCVTARTCAAGG